MRHIAFPFLAVCSLLLATGVAPAATRARYGGTVRVALQVSPSSLAISPNTGPADYWGTARILGLIADTLVQLDPWDHPQQALALSWQSDPSFRRWQFTLRPGVKFHDGSSLTAGTLAQILGDLHPDWTVRGVGESLAIESDHPMPFLLAELALPRNAIVKRNSDQVPIGTGPFRVAEFEPPRALKLVANDDCWSGRPFVDAIEFELTKSLHDQGIAFELGRADVIEAIPPATANTGSTHVRNSLPVELMALVFPQGSKAQDARVREALSLAIDRKPIQAVLFKGAADPTASLLPNWMTGYSAVFSASANLARARTLVADAPHTPLTLSYDPRDSQAQLIAERIALNAHEAGIAVQVSLAGGEDIRLVRIVLPSPDAATSLAEGARQLGVSAPTIRSNNVEDLYQAERGLLAGHAIIPLFHLPTSSSAARRVRNWEPGRRGDWNLSDVWVEADGR